MQGTIYSLPTRFNQTTSRPINHGATFNVVIDNDIFQTEAISSVVAGHLFPITPAVSNTKTFVFLIHYWTSVYNTNEVGAFLLKPGPGVWVIYKQNNAAKMPVGSKFFVLAR